MRNLSKSLGSREGNIRGCPKATVNVAFESRTELTERAAFECGADLYGRRTAVRGAAPGLKMFLMSDGIRSSEAVRAVSVLITHAARHPAIDVDR
jgi:hypothetical protein